MKEYEGFLTGEGLKVAIVAARFNAFIVEKLVEGCLDGLRRHGVADCDIEIARVPGAFEIPLAAARFSARADIDAVIALGAVIRGSTPHFDYVCAEVSKGVAHCSLTSGKPVIFGVLTTESIEQAVERAGTKAGNKGFDAACSAIETANLLKAMA